MTMMIIIDKDDTEDEDEAAAVTGQATGSLTEQRASHNTSMNRQSSQEIPATPRLIRSPFQLTTIRDLPPAHNVDAISLHDILGHPLITECWQFNFLLSIPFILEHFDHDTRPHINLKIVHGFWRNDDIRKQKLQEQQEQAVNAGCKVQLIAAHMPEMFGTHHSKMMILFRADGVAQVVMHTANMIPQDWTNMTQAVWRSPELPLLPDDKQVGVGTGGHALGTGLRFKADLLKYLGAYEGRTRSLVNELKKYDFSGIKAALISSTPGKRALDNSTNANTTAFGWPGLKQILSKVSHNVPKSGDQPVINVQISSIATLTENWMQNFFEVMKSGKMATSSNGITGASKSKPKFNIVFPTAEEIRRSLDGYSSGDSIHMKIQSAAQQKQLQMLKPMLHHWHGEIRDTFAGTKGGISKKAHRNSAAPHVKTYMHFADSSHKSIDWAMITSANLSQQAWGAVTDKNGQVRIASYEIGVIVWPELFKENAGEEVMMVPVFGKDMPDAGAAENAQVAVGVRMPYDLPLVPYGPADVPWCASMAHAEPDWMGNRWGGYEDRM